MQKQNENEAIPPLEIIENEMKIFYEKYFQQMKERVVAIDHVPDEVLEELSPGSKILIEEKQMGLSFSVIAILFGLADSLLKTITYSINIESDNIPSADQVRAEQSSKVMLCINGENQKSIHIRSELLKKNVLNVEEELHFLGVVSLRFKKSSAIWEYRLKVIEQIQEKKILDYSTLIENENEFIVKYLNKYPRNYHCWTYKTKLLKEWQIEFDLSKEISWVQQYIESNVHEYSAFSFLFFILKLRNYSETQSTLEWAQKLQERFSSLYLPHEQLGEIDYSKLLSLSKFISYLQKII